MEEHQDQLQATLHVASTVLRLLVAYICWPIGVALYYILITIVQILSLLVRILYRPVGFLLQPAVYLGRYILACLIAPYHFLVKFETLYIYLGVAALIGLTIGLINHKVYRWLQSTFGLDSVPKPPLGRTAREYRVKKQRQKLEDSAPLMSPGAQPLSTGSQGPLSPISSNGAPLSYASLSDSSRSKSGKGKGLLNQTQTIMEEADSDY